MKMKSGFIWLFVFIFTLMMALGTGLYPAFAAGNSNDCSPPAAPSNLTLTADGADVTLSWTDNSSDDLGFLVERKGQGGQWAEIASPTPNLHSFPDTLTTNGTYYYRVRAFNNCGTSDYTNQVSYVLNIVYPPDYQYRPAAPSDLKNTGSGPRVLLQWTDNSDSELGFTVQKLYQGGAWSQAGVTRENITSYSDRMTTPGTYYYRVGAFNNFGPSAWSNIITLYQPENYTEIVLKIGKPIMTVNGIEKELDPGRGTVPAIVNGRTVLPIRAIVEALGGTITWDPATQRVTIQYFDKVIELQIGSTTAYVNGNQQQLDAAPQIINGRTISPVRFVVESLGGQVDWDGTNRTVSIYEVGRPTTN